MSPRVIGHTILSAFVSYISVTQTILKASIPKMRIDQVRHVVRCLGVEDAAEAARRR